MHIILLFSVRFDDLIHLDDGIENTADPPSSLSDLDHPIQRCLSEERIDRRDFSLKSQFYKYESTRKDMHIESSTRD